MLLVEITEGSYDFLGGSEASMSELRFAKFEPFKCVLCICVLWFVSIRFVPRTVYAIFAVIRICLQTNAYSLVIIRFCP
jgi:hypothetical protein